MTPYEVPICVCVCVCVCVRTHKGCPESNASSFFHTLKQINKWKKGEYSIINFNIYIPKMLLGKIYKYKSWLYLLNPSATDRMWDKIKFSAE